MFNNNKLNLLISIVAAVVLWAWVTMAINPPITATIRGVPVEIINIEALYDRGLTIDRSQSYAVDIVVNGPRAEVRALSAIDFKATADLTGYPKGDVAVKVNVVPPRDISLSDVTPGSIGIKVVDMVSVTKPVQLVFEEDFPANVEPGFIVAMPSEMVVSGTAEDVDAVDHIRASVPAGALSDEPTTLSLVPEPITKSGEGAYYANLSTDAVQVTAKLCEVKSLPLVIEEVGEPPETIEITDKSIPARISVRGSKEAMEGLTEVVAREIDLSQLTDTVEIPVDPLLPEGVEIADRSRGLSVVIEVQGIAKKEFEYTADQIEVVNLQPGLYGHVSTGSVTVTLLAPDGALAGIAQEDIRVFVDASGITRPGDAIELAVSYECAKDHKSIAVDPEKVRVNVNNDKGNGRADAAAQGVSGAQSASGQPNAGTGAGAATAGTGTASGTGAGAGTGAGGGTGAAGSKGQQ